jgi:hypothetical protein
VDNFREKVSLSAVRESDDLKFTCLLQHADAQGSAPRKYYFAAMLFQKGLKSHPIAPAAAYLHSLEAQVEALDGSPIGVTFCQFCDLVFAGEDVEQPALVQEAAPKLHR